MLKYIEEHLKNVAEVNSRKEEIDRQIEIREDRIKRAEKQIEALREKRYNEYTSWFDDILEPLMHDLERLACEETGEIWHGEIFGPFGIFAETSIYLKRDEGKSICDQTTYRLEVFPPNNEGVMMYGTGQFTNKYPANSIAAMNGENEIKAVLPDTVEEIWKIVKKQKEGASSNG